MNRRGVVTLYITFFMVAVVVIIIAGVLAPIGVDINTRFINAGEDILDNANESIASIQDDAIRSEVGSVVDSAKASASNNISVNANLFKYSWVFVVLLAGIIVFIRTRALTELTRGFI